LFSIKDACISSYAGGNKVIYIYILTYITVNWKQTKGNVLIHTSSTYCNNFCKCMFIVYVSVFIKYCKYTCNSITKILLKKCAYVFNFLTDSSNIYNQQHHNSFTFEVFEDV